jgi:hypothetical protein
VASKGQAASAAQDKRSKKVDTAGLRRRKMIPREPAGKLVPEGLTKSAKGASGGAKTIRNAAAEGVAPEWTMINRGEMARVAPEMLAMKTKGKSPVSKMIKTVAVARLARGKMIIRMAPVGAAALPSRKTIPKARASKVVPETMAKKATSAEVASTMIRKVALERPVPERTMTNKAVAVRLVPAMMTMRAASTEVANPMMTRKAMAESKAA